MKNKTIKKLTKGIVAIALTIATVVGAGVIGAQEYNAYTTFTNSCGTQVNELCEASGNYNYSPAWRSFAEWCNTCYMGNSIASSGVLKQVGAANPYATGEDGVAQFIIKNPNIRDNISDGESVLNYIYNKIQITPTVVNPEVTNNETAKIVV